VSEPEKTVRKEVSPMETEPPLTVKQKTAADTPLYIEEKRAAGSVMVQEGSKHEPMSSHEKHQPAPPEKSPEERVAEIKEYAKRHVPRESIPKPPKESYPPK